MNNVLEQESPMGLVPAGYITLPELSRLLAQRLSDQDVSRDRPEITMLIARIFGVLIPEDDGQIHSPNQTENRSFIAWKKRELSVRLIQQGISDGNLPTFVIEPGWGLCRLLPEDWRSATLSDQVVRGGIIRALSGESLRRHEDRFVLLDRVAVHRWLARKPWRSFQRPKRRECRHWLVSEMRADPELATEEEE